MSKDFQRIGTEIGALVAVKNAAYGDAFAKCGDFLRLLYPEGIAPAQYDDALALVRIFDKQMRIATDKEALGGVAIFRHYWLWDTGGGKG